MSKVLDAIGTIIFLLSIAAIGWAFGIVNGIGSKQTTKIINECPKNQDEWQEIKTPDVVSIYENGATLEIFERETLQKVFIRKQEIKLVENAEDTIYKDFQYSLIYYK